MGRRRRASARHIGDAQRMLQQAQSEAPRHPHVLNAVARERLATGDPSGACQALTQAINAEPSNPTLWLNLASALRTLNHHDEEMAAIRRVY